MTLTDYMNLEKFPTTSQKGLSPQEQLRLDAFNYDQLEEAIVAGHQMDEEQIQIRKELQAKRPWMAELTRQIAAAINLDKMPEMALPPSDRPFKKLSPEETKSMCEQVVRFQKVMKEQLERDRKTYREMYGEEMPDM
jgi:hypothetical protein